MYKLSKIIISEFSTSDKGLNIEAEICDLPKSSIVVHYGETYQDPPKINPYEATKNALEKPLGFPPLKELAGSGKTAAIVVLF